MPFCRNCGKEVREKAKFCPKCGNNVIYTKTDAGASSLQRIKNYLPLVLGGLIIVIILFFVIWRAEKDPVQDNVSGKTPLRDTPTTSLALTTTITPTSTLNRSFISLNGQRIGRWFSSDTQSIFQVHSFNDELFADIYPSGIMSVFLNYSGSPVTVQEVRIVDRDTNKEVCEVVTRLPYGLGEDHYNKLFLGLEIVGCPKKNLGDAYSYKFHITYSKEINGIIRKNEGSLIIEGVFNKTGIV